MLFFLYTITTSAITTYTLRWIIKSMKSIQSSSNSGMFCTLPEQQQQKLIFQECEDTQVVFTQKKYETLLLLAPA